ncbi:Clp protease ClpP [Streptomyces tricolor]|uniref:ATP-dependent Clp protease proteolytic subunit n=1 Tax=Streptomyces tricolor TaxID=68277 RepID=A0ABS9JHI6_9ACTN|nr:head maturation protease, ClpP-related [Streptomyces tricolor]MCG0065028.1 Clp protease ClpP [Streptomyces tricolor]
MITVPAKLAALQARQREQADRERARLGVEARSWYRISNAASADEAEVMLYDEVGGWLGATADEFINDLRGITAPNILLRVNSPGGQVYEGIAIANALRSHPAQVTVQVDGIAASIASVIAMAGDRVRMMPNAMLMLHDASGLTFGNAADHRETAELLDKISGNIADAYAARAGGTRDEWRQVMVQETWYTAEEAVAAGLADEVVPTPKRGDGEPEMRQQFDLAAYGYHGPRPTEPKAEAEQQTTLTINIGATLDEDFVEQLRAMVRKASKPGPVEDTTPVEPVATVEHRGEPGPELVALTEPEPEAPAVDPVDEWAALTAHLIQDEPDAWSVLVSNLTTTTASSSAATEA